MDRHSFVIPAYKDSPYLEACINSLLAQTIKSEIVLCTSTPSSFLQELAQKHKLRYCIRTEPSSISGDWNFALSQATYSKVTLAHQDDLYEPSYTETVMKAFDRDPRALLVFTASHDLINGKRRGTSINALIKSILLWPFTFSKNIRNRFFKKTVLAFGDPISCPTVTLNFDAITAGFQFSAAFSCVLDWQAWLELAQQKGAFIYVPKKLVNHRIHIESETTNQISNGKRRQEEYQIFEQLWGKPIAKFLSIVYRFGHKDNVI